MVDELNHRVKNTLATVQAIAAQTLEGADGGGYRAFEGRLMALGAARDLLARESWDCADLPDVVAGQIRAFGGTDGTRFELSLDGILAAATATATAKRAPPPSNRAAA
jgi:two-component sensor histidine kinase